MDKTVQIFKALGDASRLEILRTLADGPKYVELIAEATSLTVGTVSFHLKKLEVAGLVSAKKDQYYRVFSLKPSAFDKSLSGVIGLKPDEKQLSAQDNYRKKVIDSFIRHGRLKSIPVQKKKRLVILEEIAKSFRKNREYPEKDVNRILGEFNEDFCTLRRELVSYGFIHRSRGIYIRKSN